LDTQDQQGENTRPRHESRANGQYITVLPALDMVIAHKTAVTPRNRSVRMQQYRGIIGRLVQARTTE
jgi:hypothetical protein